ncbi:MAG: zinc ribbon domain-containing protein [Gemmatimonadota bacterium]
MIIVGAICVAAAVVLYVLQPVLTGEEASLHREHDEPTEAEARKRNALLALRDVEYDHATGKLDEDDYRSLRDELTVEALEALQSMSADAARAGSAGESDGAAGAGGAGTAPVASDAVLEREIAAFRAALRVQEAGGGACPACDKPNGPASRFCAHCGVALATSEPDGPRADGAGSPGA